MFTNFYVQHLTEVMFICASKVVFMSECSNVMEIPFV
jgi:hypothetical protein